MTPKATAPAPTMGDILKMDGRKRLAAPSVLGPVGVPTKFSVAFVRATINGFLTCGQTVHSSRRGLLGFVVAYCEENAIPYSVHAAFTNEGRRGGYVVKREAPL